MDALKKELIDLGIIIIKVIKVAVVYLLPSIAIAYYTGKPEYGYLANAIEVFVAQLLKQKILPDNDLVQKVL
jgi:hypothetical protein